MKVQIAQHDLRAPATGIPVRNGYGWMLVLVREARRPLGVIDVPLADRTAPITAAELREAIDVQLGISPDEQDVWTAEPPPPACDAGPPISVVVGTRDRPESLRRCLAALRRIEYDDYEVIVVDNASRSQATRKVVADTSFRYVREEREGLSWARNRGVSEARYGIVAFTDDDVEVDPGWLRGVADALSDPTVEAATGLVLAAELETYAQQLYEHYGGMSKGVAPREFVRDGMSPRDLLAMYEVGVGANMAFRRRVFNRIGGFDTALGPGTPSGGADDLDIFHRVLTAGMKLRYEPTALVWHHHRGDMRALRRQIHDNGRAFGVFLIKTWRSGAVEGREMLRFAVGQWWWSWLVTHVGRSLLKRHRLPLRLVLAELYGAHTAPWAYLATRQRGRRALRPSTGT
ncbi:hypothetical protein BH23GEM3_BH23GEM3_08160 [soil metagenome]